MSIIQIEEHCERKGTHILWALYGESGSGKTQSALLLARGLAGDKGKVMLLDTENGRGRMYASKIPGGYGYAELTGPFTGDRYIEAIQDIEKAGYDVLVIDSASHEWEGYGGVLEQADTNGFNGLIKWAKPKAKHKQFVQALLRTRMHIIFCLRAKEKMVQRGKDVISEGYVSIQDKRFIFEMTGQLFMEARDIDNGKQGGFYRAEKCPGDLLAAFAAKGQQLGIEAGQAIRIWLGEENPVNHMIEQLRKEGETEAGRGSVAFAAWWNREDVKPHRAGGLRAYLPNFQSIVLEADRQIAEQAVLEQADDPMPSDGMLNEENPFGAPEYAEAAE